MEANYSLVDIASIVGNKDNGFLEGNGIIILILFFLMFGGLGGAWGNNATAQTITNDFLYTNLSNQLGRTGDRIENTLNTGFTAVAQQGFQIDKDLLNQTNAINQTLSNGFAGVNANITDIGYRMQNCCCELKTAIHAEGEATRQLIQSNTIQDLRDKLAEKDNTLQSANLTLANANQTQNILNALGSYVPTSNNGCGCNCY